MPLICYSFNSRTTYDAFGNSAVIPGQRTRQRDFGWLGRYQRPLEHEGSITTIKVWTRPYAPWLGRLLGGLVRWSVGRRAPISMGSATRVLAPSWTVEMGM